jgi:cytochrome c-type biogenesis protein CcmH
MIRRWLPWLALLLVVAAALAVAAGRGGRPATPEQRALHVAAQLRCPTCRGQSAAVSDAPASQAIRAEIRRRVAAGQTDAQIRAYFVDRYGKDILLSPEAGGIDGLVWVLPVVAVAVAVAGLALAFRRWRPLADVVVSDDDRRLVEEALRAP